MDSDFRRVFGKMAPQVRRSLLPDPLSFYIEQLGQIKGGGTWRDALCPFHQDARPSLRVNIKNGAFRCFSCGAHGGDVISFYMKRYGCDFRTACGALNCWVERGRHV